MDLVYLADAPGRRILEESRSEARKTRCEVVGHARSDRIARRRLVQRPSDPRSPRGGRGRMALSEPIHLLAARCVRRAVDAKRRRSSHVCSHRLPERSYRQASSRVMVASPELTCLSIRRRPDAPFPLPRRDSSTRRSSADDLPPARRPRGDARRSLPPATTVAGIAPLSPTRARGVRGAADVKRAFARLARATTPLSPMETDHSRQPEVFRSAPMGGVGLEKTAAGTGVSRSDEEKPPVALPQSA